MISIGGGEEEDRRRESYERKPWTSTMSNGLASTVLLQRLHWRDHSLSLESRRQKVAPESS